MTIQTTHVGSLPRSQEVVDQLFARERNEAFDPGVFDVPVRVLPVRVLPVRVLPVRVLPARVLTVWTMAFTTRMVGAPFVQGPRYR